MPPPPEGEQIRFFWNTPMLLSPHNPRLLYIGANRLFQSYDRGDTYLDIARPDEEHQPLRAADHGRRRRRADGVQARRRRRIQQHRHDQRVARHAGVIWVGTNDGNVQVSRDGGATWKNVVDNVPGVPKETHVSRVEASHFDAGTCYVAFDGHRTDDHKPYVFVTRDYGATWKPLATTCPPATSTSCKEDPKNPNLLYVGTEYGLYVSLNGGAEWKRFMNGMPTVRIDDILVHPRDNDLIVATHGRSIWILDDITPLQQLSEKVTAADAHLFDVRPAVAWADRRHAQPDDWRREALPRREPAARHGHQLLPEVGRRRAT